MKSREALCIIAEITEGQWGLVTSAQARSRHVSPMNITRLCESGDLIRIGHGVYRNAGSPNDEHESLRAAWLMADPLPLAYERLAEHPIRFVVSGESAARLHAIGDLRAQRHEFTTPQRKQTQRSDTRYRIAILPKQDITITAGLPVTTRERTIADLVEHNYDLSLVADVLRDAVNQSNLNTVRLIELLSPLAKRNGHNSNDGAAMLEQLQSIAGMDRNTLAQAIARDSNLAGLVTGRYLKKLSESLNTLRSSNTIAIQQDAASPLDTLRGIPFHSADLSIIRSVLQHIDASQTARLSDVLKSLDIPDLWGIVQSLALIAQTPQKATTRSPIFQETVAASPASDDDPDMVATTRDTMSKGKSQSKDEHNHDRYND